MLASAVSRLLPGITRAGCGIAASARAAAGAPLLEVLRGAAGPSSASSLATTFPTFTPTYSYSIQSPELPERISSGAAVTSTSGSTEGTVGVASDSTISPPPTDPAPTAAAVPSSGPASRRDKDASADTIYPSSHDDNLGVQRNWFNALFSQLNVVHRTGMVPHMKGRQKEVFCAVEREFEALWERHVRGKGLEGTAHRGMMLCCLAVATHKVLRYESGDDELVKEIVRTNLGGMAVNVMMRLHKARLWLLLKLLAEDPYKQAVRFLPTLQGDLGSLVSSEVAVGDAEATWNARGCAFHSVLAAEDATELLPEFCCQFSMQWLEGFAQYGVRVGLEQSVGFGDDCCMVRISRPGGAQRGVDGPPFEGGSHRQ